jgi:hypothetical protein
MDNSNGQGPRIPRRETWVELPTEYPDFKFKMWVNAPQRLWNDIRDVDQDLSRALAALKQIILEHNGWLDFDESPYPPATEDAFWDAIPTELAGTIIAACNAEMTKLPNSLAPKRRSSRRG